MTGVPDGTLVAELRTALDSTGAADWNDDGIPWGNHDIRRPGRTGTGPRGTLSTPQTPASAGTSSRPRPTPPSAESHPRPRPPLRGPHRLRCPHPPPRQPRP